MLPRSSTFTLIFVTLAALLVGFYAIGQVHPILVGLGLSPDYADIFCVLVLIALSLISTQAGGEKGIIVTVATIAGFIILTLVFEVHQYNGREIFVAAPQTPLIRYLTLAALLFSIGAYGMVVSRNAVRVLISIELMLNAVNINLVAFARYVDPDKIQGQLFAIFILTVAAAEAAVGLAIVLAIYRNMATVDMEKFNLLKW